MQLNVKYFDPQIPKIKKIENGDWIDLRVVGLKINGIDQDWNDGSVSYRAGDFIMINTGVAMKLPSGFEGHVSPRSSTFKKFGLIQTNSVGVIDESYCGDNDQWFIPMIAMRDGSFDQYDRVAQFRILEKMPTLTITECTSLNGPDRGGHGSTGYK